MRFHLTYDMRAPAFGADSNRLYSAMLEQVAWADALGFDAVGLGEHHSSEDGYNPSPLIVGAAIAACTRRLQLQTAVLLAPLYDLPKLAEDAAVLQLLSNGRLQLGIGGGYRQQEFTTFGRALEQRWQAVGETVAYLRQAWRGLPFTWQGREVLITPVPRPQPPPIVLGGGSAAAARRAARIADGWMPPLDPRLWQPYRDECVLLGKPDPGDYPAQGPVFLWVARDVEAAWTRLMPHIMHQFDSYNRWTNAAMGRAAGPYAAGTSAEQIRASSQYQVLTPEQTLALFERLGDHSVVYLSPLLAGIQPDWAWQMLRLFETEVWPHIAGRA